MMKKCFLPGIIFLFVVSLVIFWSCEKDKPETDNIFTEIVIDDPDQKSKPIDLTKTTQARVLSFEGTNHGMYSTGTILALEVGSDAYHGNWVVRATDPYDCVLYGQIDTISFGIGDLDSSKHTVLGFYYKYVGDGWDSWPIGGPFQSLKITATIEGACSPPNYPKHFPITQSMTDYAYGEIDLTQLWYDKGIDPTDNGGLEDISVQFTFFSYVEYADIETLGERIDFDYLIIFNKCVASAPSTLGSITANSSVCSGGNLSASVSAVSGVDVWYEWTYDGTYTSITGNGTTSITVNGITSAGELGCYAHNCAGGSYSTKQISLTPVPNTPVQPYGNSYSVCSGSGNVYNTNSVSGATSYTWEYSGSYTQLTNNGTSCTLVPTSNGNLKVKANGECGSSGWSTVRAITVNNAPATPGAINGQAFPMTGRNYTYSISPVSGATSYTWQCDIPGAQLTPNGTSCTIYWPYGGDGLVKVKANNSCGSSAFATKYVYVAGE